MEIFIISGGKKEVICYNSVRRKSKAVIQSLRFSKSYIDRVVWIIGVVLRVI